MARKEKNASLLGYKPQRLGLGPMPNANPGIEEPKLPHWFGPRSNWMPARYLKNVLAGIHPLGQPLDDDRRHTCGNCGGCDRLRRHSSCKELAESHGVWRIRESWRACTSWSRRWP